MPLSSHRKLSPIRLRIIFLLAFISAPGLLFSQWKWLNPQPAGNGYNKVKFTTRKDGYILNNNGDLMSTNDQGNTWHLVRNFPHTIMMDIADSTGAIVGYNGTLYVTGDNGFSWQQIITGIPDNFLLVQIVNRNTFFIGGSNGAIYKTTDKGQTWQTLHIDGQQLSAIDFVDSNVGYAGCTGSAILKTIDGGVTWQTMNSVNYFPSTISAVQFLTRDTGFAFRYWDSLLSTTDGGKTWIPHQAPATIYTMCFINSRLGYVAGEDGFMYRTINGGQSWDYIGLNGGIYNNDINSLYFISAESGFAVGARGRILSTTDSGTTWHAYSPEYNDMTGISFPTPSTGYATSGNHVYKTTDTGQSWQQLELTVGTDFGSYSGFEWLHFFSADTGIVTSSSYILAYKTYDGGKSWNTIRPTEYLWNSITGMSFVSSTTGYISITDQNGNAAVYKTSDAGETWSQVWMAQYANQFISQVFFVDEKTGYGIQGGQVVRTKDSAKSWSSVLAPPGFNFNEFKTVCFANAQKGFAGGEQGLLYATNDGGNTWNQVLFNDTYTNDILAIKFYNEQVGYFTETGGEVYKTYDGGTTWQLNGNFGGYDCKNIELSKDTSVYIAGMYGAIIKSGVKGFGIDSLEVNVDSCTSSFSASIGVALGSIDSAWFEYGINNFANAVAIVPASVTNGRITGKAFAHNLVPGTTYLLRVKVLFDDVYYYNEQVSFVAQGIATPYIRESGNTLFSNSQVGNQWYFNGTPIPGAVDSQYEAKASGQYTVKVIKGGCYSAFSNSLNVVVSNLGVVVFPNPVQSSLTIENTQSRQLYLILADALGNVVNKATISSYRFTITTSGLSPGIYWLGVIDAKTGERAGISILKL